ncbi:MAG: hypothetical protein Fur0043_02010 [Anaerolineales bacterium]
MPFSLLSSCLPEHRSLRLAWGWTILAALEGAGAFLWLALQPSEAGNRIFLHYSLQRWLLLGLTFLLLLAVLSVLWMFARWPAWAHVQLTFWGQPRHAAWLLIVTSLLLLLAGGVFIWLSRQAALATYFTRLLPLLVWFLLALAQAWVALLVALRHDFVQVWRDSFPIQKKQHIIPLKADTFLWPVLLALTLLYLTVQVHACFLVSKASLFADSEDYLYGASLPLTDAAFFSERRPWGILLIYKLLNGSLTAIHLFQVALSAAAWLGLAWTFIRSLQNRWIKLTGFSLLLGFSLTPTVQVWNHAVLSESLSISGLVIILALFLRLTQGWQWRTFFFLAFSFILWMSVRETHTYLGVLVAGVLFLLGFLRRTWRVYWLLMLCILLTFFVNNRLAAAYRLPRWALPMAEVITMRILPEPEYLDFFARQGMPTPPELLALSGKWAISNDFAIVNDLKLRKFSRWLFHDSQRVYIRFLLTHPDYLLWTPWENIRRLLAADYVNVLPIENYRPALPALLNELLYPLAWFWPAWEISLFALGGILVVVILRRWGQYSLPFLFFLLSIPHLYLAWHGDALDVERHAVLVNVQWHVGIALIMLLFLDDLMRRARRQA